MDHLELIGSLAVVAGAALATYLAAGSRRRWAVVPRNDDPRVPPPAALDERARASRVAASDALWTRRVLEEQARFERHGRGAAIVAMHLGGPTGAIGRRSARRRAQDARLAERIARRIRLTDAVRAGTDGVVRVLLADTDEHGGRAYIRRVAAVLPDWGADLDGEPSLTAGWAGTTSGRDLRSADRLACARLRGASAGWLRSEAAASATWPPIPRRPPAFSGHDALRRPRDYSGDSRTRPSRRA